MAKGEISIVVGAKDKFSKTFSSLGGKIIALNQGLELLKKVTLPIANIFASVVQEGMKFEQQMANVKAISKLTTVEFAALSDEAERIGATTQFTAVQAGEAMEELRRAGLSVSQIMEATSEAMSLAAATGSDLGTAAQVTAIQIKLFGSTTKNTTEIVDLLVKATAASPQNFGDMAEAMAWAGSTASTLGVEMKEVVTIIALMAESGFRASKAGRAFNASMSKLKDVTPDARKALADYSLTVKDIDPELRSMRDIIGTLSKAQMGFADITKIFGRDAGPKWVKIIKDGTAGYDAMTKKMKEANTAQEAAIARLDTFSGAMTIMNSAIAGLKIKIFKTFQHQLRGLVEWVTRLASEMGKWVKEHKTEIIEFLADMAEKVVSVKNSISDWVTKNSPEIKAFFGLIVDGFKLVFTVVGWVASALGTVYDVFQMGSRNQVKALKAQDAALAKTTKTVREQVLAFVELAEGNEEARKKVLAMANATEEAAEKQRQAWIRTADNFKQYGTDMAAMADIQNELTLESITNKFAKERLVAEQVFQARLEAFKENALMIEQLTTAHRTRISAINAAEDAADLKASKASFKMKATAVAQSLSAIGNVFSAMAAEAKGKGKKGFEEWKRYARASVIISTAAAIASNLATLPAPVGWIKMAAAAAVGAIQLRTIDNTAAPSAHGGLDRVPREQTYLLDKGERVLSPNQNRDLTSFLQGQQGGGGRGVVINVQGNDPRETAEQIRDVMEEFSALERFAV